MTLHGAVLARDALPQLGRVFGSGTPTRPWNDGLQLLRYTRGVSLPPILLGTSSFTASGWAGSFYPKGMRPADYLSFYAEHFPAVEVDSTFYACPAVQTVSNWAARTPEGFTFAVKVPQAITHEKALAGCDAELTEFLKTMDILGAKLGPICLPVPLLQ